jgi:pyruvate dehydrogenase E2 component (dihydrolipoamide acetyltransferase)
MSELVPIKVPDIGDFKEVEVIELLVKPGDTVALEQSLITVESDKASMEIPSSAAGVIDSLTVKIGDKVAMGSLVAMLRASGTVAPSAPAVGSAPPMAQAAQEVQNAGPAQSLPAASVAVPAPASVATASAGTVSMPTQGSFASVNSGQGLPHASPSVRKFARELGADLQKIRGTGPKGRITPLDVRAFIKNALTSSAVSSAVSSPTNTTGLASLGIPAWPQVDFAKFGPITTTPMSRIKRISGPALHRNWVMIPHVTNNEDADITELEAFRVKLNQENEKSGIKLTMLAFLIKASVIALKKFPDFNASIDGESIVHKQYYHIGFAADTPNGLVVPVIRDADKKGLFEIATEMSELAKKARDGKLSPGDMQGGTFSISSLGGIGGTSFTPIINAPEVAILGVSRSSMKPVWDGTAFVPRLILPMSLSWDHRVVDGASAARFNAFLAALLADFRRAAL